MDIVRILEHFFREEAPLGPGERLLVAFSGGTDSTALLWGLARLAREPGWDFELRAAHLDHGLDPGSAERAAGAARLAGDLDIPFLVERRDVRSCRRGGESLEEAARRVRYEVLDQARREAGARWTATAHHRDDQAETVLLRMLYGTGVAGLAGIRRRRATVVRPLLGVPRRELAATVAAAGLRPLEDPTNDDLAVPRNRLRHRLLPTLAAADPEVSARLARLAGAAERAAARIEAMVDAAMDPALGGSPALDRRRLEELPEELRAFALAGLHREAGLPYPSGSAARRELARQLRSGAAVGCDCGGGWRWEERRQAGADRLVLRRPPSTAAADFTYTLEIPGKLEIPELSLRVSLDRREVAPWMFRGAPDRAGLALPLGPGDQVIVRNRRPGDRLRPLGSAGSRRLKDVLIDRRVPREQRGCLPLVCVGERIAWVPGVTVDERFRLSGGETTAWIAEVTTP